jgi:hypothetical protein
VIFVATVYSHFGAIRYRKECERKKLSARMSPVPRALSSSCGTCVLVEAGSYSDLPAPTEEVEQIAGETPDGYHFYYQAEKD